MRFSRRSSLLSSSTFLGLAAAMTCTSVHAQTWTGTASNDWFNAANWTNPQSVPQGTLSVFLTTGANPTVINAGTAVSGLLEVGNNPGDVASLTIQNGAILNTGNGSGSDIGNASGSTGTVIVTSGSSWNLANLLSVGTGGMGTLIISNGGRVSDGGNGSFIGFETGSVGTVIVTGPGSVWNTSAALRVGGTTGGGGGAPPGSGTGTLTIADSGVVNVAGGTGTVFVAQPAGSNGTVNIGAAPPNAPVAPGTLNAANVVFGAGTGTLNFNHTSTNYVFAPAISGNGSVNVLAGVTTLTANNTYTGATTISGGALIVNGSIASSSLTTVNSGAALIGSGIVGSTVVNAGGFLVPGPVGTPGTMTVAGNLAFQSGAFYVVQVNPATASTTNVSGTASLAGTVGAIFFPGTYMERSYPIVTAAGGRIGTFDALATFGLPAHFQASLSYPGNTAVLNLTAQLVPEPTPSPTLPTQPPVPPVPGLPPVPEDPPAPPPPPFTVNQRNVGHAIDNFFNNGGALPPAFVSLFNLTGSNLTTALDQLSGEAATGAQKVAFQLTDQFLGLMLDPFVDGRCGIGRTDQPPLGFAGDCETRPSALGFAPERETMPPAIALAYASVLKEPRAPLAPVYEPRWTAWAGAYGGSNRTTGDLAIIGSHDLSARTVGGAAGLDYHLTPDTVVGFALGGGGTDWSLSQGLGGGKSDAFQAGLYGATRWGPAYLAADFAFTNHWMSTDRLAVGNHLTADFNAQSYGGRLEGGYRFGMLYGGITPYAAIQAQSFHTPGFTETDAIANGFGLAFGSRDATDTRSELGTRFDRVLAVYSNAVLALRGRVAWAHDWVSDATLMPVFQSLPGASFIVNGATLPKNSALTSAGAELRLANGVTLLAKFDGDFASHSSTYGGTGTFRYRW
jgi:T5SS/PEP-CTERM-associated repeat protein/autotransporter-associated beta strand protein